MQIRLIYIDANNGENANMDANNKENRSLKSMRRLQSTITGINVNQNKFKPTLSGVILSSEECKNLHTSNTPVSIIFIDVVQFFFQLNKVPPFLLSKLGFITQLKSVLYGLIKRQRV